MQPKKTPSRRPLSHLIAAIISAACAAFFGFLAFAAPVFSEVSERMNFTELDRAGVINAPALAKLDSSYGFGNADTLEYRRTVPDFIARSPLAAERRNAIFGLIFALGNTAAWFIAWWRPQRSEAAE